MFFIAGLLAVVLVSVTDVLTRWLRVPRGAGLALSLVILLGTLFLIGALLAPAVGGQISDLTDAVPRYMTSFDAWVRELAARSALLRRTGIASTENGIVTTLINDVLDFVRRSVLAYATAGGRLVIDVVAVLVMALYLALRPGIYKEGLIQLVPPDYRQLARDIIEDVRDTLRAWAGAQVLAMIVLGTLTAIGLWLLQVPYWLAFGAFTGVVVLVPFFGSIVSTLVPALLILPERGPFAFLLVASIGVVVHIIEANIVSPLIMQHKVALPPVLTIFIVLVMGRLAGVLGLLVAVPLLATAFVVIRHVLIYRTYGERPAAEAAVHAVLQPRRSRAETVAPSPG